MFKTYSVIIIIIITIVIIVIVIIVIIVIVIIIIIILVPPSVPMISVMEVTPFEATVSITHTNITPDDAPDQIRLTIADANDVIDIIELEGHHMEYTFNELTPFQQYHVSISVKNADGNKDGETVYITTSTSGIVVVIVVVVVVIIVIIYRTVII